MFNASVQHIKERDDKAKAEADFISDEKRRRELMMKHQMEKLKK